SRHPASIKAVHDNGCDPSLIHSIDCSVQASCEPWDESEGPDCLPTHVRYRLHNPSCCDPRKVAYLPVLYVYMYVFVYIVRGITSSNIIRRKLRLNFCNICCCHDQPWSCSYLAISHVIQVGELEVKDGSRAGEARWNNDRSHGCNNPDILQRRSTQELVKEHPLEPRKSPPDSWNQQLPRSAYCTRKLHLSSYLVNNADQNGREVPELSLLEHGSDATDGIDSVALFLRVRGEGLEPMEARMEHRTSCSWFRGTDAREPNSC
ncbi:hypothetical protein LINPERPRIM_LOCUS19546, partial [Linum perenne]